MMAALNSIRIGVYPGPTGRIIVAPLYLGLYCGFFDEENIEVEIREPEDHPWYAAGRGDIDCGLSYVDYCTWEPLFGKIKVIAVHEQYTPGRGMTCLMARSELFEAGRITDEPNSIKGLRIGLLPGRGDDYLVFRGLLDQAGLTMDDVQPVPVPHGGAARREWVEGGKVDITIGRRPASIAAELATGRLRVWKAGDDIYPGFQARFFVATTQFLAHSRPLLVRWLRAYQRGTAAVLDSYERARTGDVGGIELVSELTGEPVDRLLSVKPVGYSASGSIDVARLEAEVAKLREAALFPADLPVADVIDTTCVADALAPAS